MDEQTLIATYHEHVAPLYRYVSTRCGGDRALAEDVTQEVWLRAVGAWKRDGLPDHPLAWLKTVARNLIANHYRKVSPASLESLPRDLEPKAGDDGIPWDSPDHAALVSWGLARLKPDQARMIEAFHLEGQSVAEIASEMGLSERAVEGRLRRARVKLRKKIEKVR
jgi:RNA polymerase sigma-70 factor (ECF subfamily)